MKNKMTRKNHLTTQQKNRELLKTAHRFLEAYTPTAWCEKNPTATLFELKERLEGAIEECINFGDELISDHEGDIGEALQDELDQWELSGNVP